jgi:hypothetical protein
MEDKTLTIDITALDDDTNNKVNIILGQTDYTQEIALEKLKECNYDHIKVIKGFLGIAEKKAPEKVASVNQEIYKQIRHNLNSVMRDYNIRKENGETKNV